MIPLNSLHTTLKPTVLSKTNLPRSIRRGVAGIESELSRSAAVAYPKDIEQIKHNINDIRLPLSEIDRYIDRMRDGET